MKDAITQLLLIRDHPDASPFLTEILRAEGQSEQFAWTIAGGLDEALPLLSLQPFDAILLDFSRADQSVLAALARLKAAAPHTPIIALTELPDEVLALAALRAGAQDCLAKTGLTPEILRRSIRYAIERTAFLTAPTAPESQTSLLPETSPVMLPLNAEHSVEETIRLLQQYNRRIQVLHNIDRGIMTTQPPQKIASMIARNLSDMINCDAIRIVAIDSRGNSPIYYASYPPTSQRSQELLEAAIKNYGFPESFRRGQALLIGDTQTHENFWDGFEELLTRKGARSWIVIPLFTGTKLFGMLAAGSSQPHAFSAEHYDIAREVADQLAIALHKADLDEQVLAHAQDLEIRVAERTEQLRQAKERTEIVLSSTSDAIVVASVEGVIEQVNPAFETLFGFSIEQAASISLLSLVDAPSVDTLTGSLRNSLTGAGPGRAELVCIRQDETSFDADAAFASVAHDQSLSVICSFRDITPRKQAEKELREALEYERELGILKMRFVSIVSHEFRTPLAAILSSSDLLKHYSDRMDAERKLEHLDGIQAQVERLTDLLEDTLFLSKSELVGIQVESAKMDFEAFCRNLVAEIQLIAPAHPIKFTSAAPGLRMNMDAKLMRQVVTNLLSNAIKYSPDASPVELDLARQDNTLVVLVRDYGVGIPQEDQKHLFEIFHRATNVGTTPGTGVGLTIVKRAVEAHGGTIHIESAVGSGTVVTLTFPLPTTQKSNP